MSLSTLLDVTDVFEITPDAPGYDRELTTAGMPTSLPFFYSDWDEYPPAPPRLSDEEPLGFTFAVGATELAEISSLPEISFSPDDVTFDLATQVSLIPERMGGGCSGSTPTLCQTHTYECGCADTVQDDVACDD